MDECKPLVCGASEGSLGSLSATYTDFCNFGGGSGAQTDMMDGAKWAKFWHGRDRKITLPTSSTAL